MKCSIMKLSFFLDTTLEFESTHGFSDHFDHKSSTYRFSSYNTRSRWVSVVEFHDQALSIGKVFGQESTVVKLDYQILSLHLVTVCQKVPILDFQSEFSMSKIIPIFLKKSLKKINLGAPFL